MTIVNFQNDTQTHRTSGTIVLFQKKNTIYPPVQIITGYSLNLNENIFLPIHWLNIIINMLRFNRIGLHICYVSSTCSLNWTDGGYIGPSDGCGSHTIGHFDKIQDGCHFTEWL